jgi:hypothetical protein
VKRSANCNPEFPKYLYINCDAVETQHVGNTIAQLLRVVRVPSDGRLTQDKDWSVPHYKPVSQPFFHQMEVDIRDERGCKVSFDNGVVIATLHFKRIH